ncbi:hypothetical protein O181_001260 [Austropuccinia psidii MF-1]|uniref:Mediator of RNA polymerase II transcription subunit 7 n=1 Tax=Austropuccinia psidii MF-1 TaxID=1389203 RepID=A0A9Q3GBN2_9BASI|nr:hypothetical protein [Austropuccinia psidii MF-1]
MESNEVNSSFFPPPPTRYRLFTNRNITLANRLVERFNDKKLSWTVFDPTLQRQELVDLTSKIAVVENDLHQIENVDLISLLKPPNLDWVRENGGWTAFGDWEPWPGKSSLASLEGMPKLYDESMERKEALQALLNTLIHSYLQLLDVLGKHGPTSMAVLNESNQGQVTSNTDQIVSHIELAAFNMHGLCNELRPRQARETLKLMMAEQAREKREKAHMILETCEKLKVKLASLKISEDQLAQFSSKPPIDNQNTQLDTKFCVETDFEQLLKVADDILNET